MTRNFKLTPEGDIEMTRGQFTLVDDPAQRVTTRLRMLLGEWFLATNDGTPYLQEILIKNPNIDHIRSALRARVLGTEGITAILQFDLDFDHVRRRLSLDMIAVGPAGPFEVRV